MNSKEKEAEQPLLKTIFNEMFNSDLPPEEISVERLKDEAAVFVGAGTNTVRNTLHIASFNVLSPAIHSRLREKLTKAMLNKNITLPWAELESLPYLSAVIQECK